MDDGAQRSRGPRVTGAQTYGSRDSSIDPTSLKPTGQFGGPQKGKKLAQRADMDKQKLAKKEAS